MKHWNENALSLCLWLHLTAHLETYYSLKFILDKKWLCSSFKISGAKPLSWLNLSQMCSYVICLHVMHPLCPIEKIVQMDQISSRLTRCHRHLALGVGRFISHSSRPISVRVSEFIYQMNFIIPPERQVVARITAQQIQFWFHALVDKADRGQRTGSRWPNLVCIRHEYLVRSLFDSKVP